MVEGFSVQNFKLKLIRHPIEDCFSFSKNKKILAVADGVTRDPSQTLPNLSTLGGKIDFALMYPKPSPASIASEIFCEEFSKELENYDIKERFKIANQKIGHWNIENMQNHDYITRDLAGCVAAGAILNGNSVKWGFISDCGLAIYDKKANLKFKTPDEGPSVHNEQIWKDKRLKNMTWENPGARKIVRMFYRNNPFERFSYGVLTGENYSLNYLRTGENALEIGEQVVLYTDGLDKILYDSKFCDLLRKRSKEGIRKLAGKIVKGEGTLLYTSV